MTMLQHAILILVLPLASAAIIALFLRRSGGFAAALSTLTAAVIAVVAVILALHGERFEQSQPWLQLGDFTLSLGIKFDDLAALMLVIVAIVGLCVHVFSIGYMHADGARGRYFGGLSIFMFSMIGIVLADNLFMMFIYWELVGFSSWLLINHYLNRQSAADAAKKAFIVNRVGDFGFLLGIIWCYAQFGTTNLTQLAAMVGGPTGQAIPTAIPLLLFCGAVGKSAQLPLHVWLPDAMEGPTPVSALIHAATMVAAGIYMLCRIEPLMVPDAFTVIMWIGTVTAVYAALCAIVQSDIKKVLAYSTLSQLGYMVAAFGLGPLNLSHDMGGGMMHSALVRAGVGAAMFHLMTHAFFKGLLFLGSGSVIHACHHEQDIFRLGGLMKRLPLTFVTFTTGVLAIIGTPFLAGFFSKDAILYLAYMKNAPVFALLAFTAILTAFYMLRLWILVFTGAPRSDEADHAHEGGIAMTAPLVVLAVLSLIGGYGWFYGGLFRGAFGDVLDLVPHATGSAGTVVLATSIGVLVLGALVAFLVYKPAPQDALATKSPLVFGGLRALWASFDRAYDYYVAKVQQRFAMVLNFIEQIFLAGLIVRGFAGIVGLFGLGARALHVGNLNAYAYWFLLGIVGLWAFASGVLTF